MKSKPSARFGSGSKVDWWLVWPWIANLTQCLDLNKKRDALISQKRFLEHPCYEILILPWLSILHNIELMTLSSFSLNYQPRSRRFCQRAWQRCTCDHTGLEPLSSAESSSSGGQSLMPPPWQWQEETLHQRRDWRQRCSLSEEVPNVHWKQASEQGVLLHFKRLTCGRVLLPLSVYLVGTKNFRYMNFYERREASVENGY